MADLPTAYPLRDLFDAAVRGRSIKLTCQRCGHVSILNAYALWWLFHRKGWSDRFADVQKRCTCMICWYRLEEKIRRPSLELVHDEPTETRLAMPSEAGLEKGAATAALSRHRLKERGCAACG